MVQIRLTINGEARQIDVDPRQSLLDVLREAPGRRVRELPIGIEALL